MIALTLVRDRTRCVLGESSPSCCQRIACTYLKLLRAPPIGWDYLITCLPGSPAC